METTRFNPGRRIKPGVLAAVLLLHLVAGLLLVRALAPDFTAKATQQALATFTVIVPTPSPPPSSRPEPTQSASPAVASVRERGHVAAMAPPAVKAVPRPVTAPLARLALAQRAAPNVAASDDARRAGAAMAGTGSRFAGAGSGLGAGGQGDGGALGGSGGASKLVKIAGDIQSAHDYPKQTRALRLGDYVEIALSVGRDGKVTDCRIQRPSRDSQADQITCRLARERFRFKPASDRAGNAIAAVYGWRQRWYN